jgi:hypothetical protein
MREEIKIYHELHPTIQNKLKNTKTINKNK